MKTKFLLNTVSESFGIGGQQIVGSNIIVIDNYKVVPNFDYKEVIQRTNTFYKDKEILSIIVETIGAVMFTGVIPLGYNSHITHTLNVDQYIKAEFKKLDADPGDPFGGGFHNLETVFGSRNINYLPNEIAFEIDQNDSIIQLDKTYQFNLYFTINEGGGGSEF